MEIYKLVLIKYKCTSIDNEMQYSEMFMLLSVVLSARVLKTYTPVWQPIIITYSRISISRTWISRILALSKTNLALGTLFQVQITRSTN